MIEPATVHVVDDDEAMRESLSFMLEAHGMTVRSFASAEAFLEIAGSIAPGCVVSDVRMPGMSGVELLRKLGELAPDLPVVIITGHGDVALAVEAMKCGAADFIEKPFDDSVLVKAVSEACERTRRATSQEAAAREVAAQLAALSPRERDVLAGLLDGKPNKTIAHDLGISPRTVEVYRANLMNKMEANSLSELIRKALSARA